MITSSSNSKVKYVRRLQSDRRFRHKEKRFVIEGTRWLTELTAVPHLIDFILYTPRWQETAVSPSLLQQLNAPHFLVDDKIMADISDTTTPSGILAVVHIHPPAIPPQADFLLVLDGINTPGNLGTILRTAGAAGVSAVLLAPGCVDAYNPKVVRSSMGAHLRLPIRVLNWAEIGEMVAHTAVWLAAVDEGKVYTAVARNQPVTLIIGSEAHGGSQQARQLAQGNVTIPMHAQTESLNAAMATGIILFEAVRQRS